MKNRTPKIRWILTLAATVVMVMGFITPATTASASTPVETNRLVLQEFRQQAQEAGLSDTQIEQGLQHPELITTAAITGEKIRQGVTPASSAGSNSVWVSVWYNNIFGMRLMTFNVTKEWSWSGGRVTFAPPPIVKGSVSTIAQVGGWTYDGVVAQVDYFYDSSSIDGTDPHSGHRSYRQGQFHVCTIKVGCFQQKQPVIDIRVNAHGGLAVSTAR